MTERDDNLTRCVVPIVTGICAEDSKGYSERFGGPCCDWHWPLETEWQRYLAQHPGEVVPRPQHNRHKAACQALGITSHFALWAWGERLWSAIHEELRLMNLDVARFSPVTAMTDGLVEDPRRRGWFVIKWVFRFFGMDHEAFMKEKEAMVRQVQDAQVGKVTGAW